MKRVFALSRLDAALLAVNLIAFGGCLTLLAIKGGSVPLVLITVGSGLSGLVKLARSYFHPAERP